MLNRHYNHIINPDKQQEKITTCLVTGITGIKFQIDIFTVHVQLTIMYRLS